MGWRLLERLEECHLGLFGKVGGIVDDDDPSSPLERTERQILLHLPICSIVIIFLSTLLWPFFSPRCSI